MKMRRTSRAAIAFLALSTGACLTAEAGPTDAGFGAEQSVEFESEGVTLAGTLWLPTGPGPHPAMVYVHGSGRATRSTGEFVAEHFRRAGVAVLAYDKRGTGQSGGTYVGRENGSEQNLTLLARDATAALALLRDHESIDPDQIGLWGISQAGWIVPVAAVLDGDVAFTVLMSGPTVTVGEEMFYSDLTGDNSATRATLSQEEISRLLAEHGPFGFDPMPYLKQMDMPGFWMLGSADESIPIPETIALLDELIGVYDRDFSYRIWEGASHGLRVDGQRVPDFWTAQDAFLFETVGVRVR